MKSTIALFPGTFRPWHKGHSHILLQACKVFDQVIIAVMVNPDKPKAKGKVPKFVKERMKDQVLVVQYSGLLRDLVRKLHPDAIVRGLRSSADFEHEKASLYWNEDLGVDVPTFYVISPRELTHVSSSALRTVEALTGGKK